MSVKGLIFIQAVELSARNVLKQDAAAAAAAAVMAAKKLVSCLRDTAQRELLHQIDDERLLQVAILEGLHCHWEGG